MVVQKLKQGHSHREYQLKLNSHLKRVILKLNQEKVIEDLFFNRNYCSFYPVNLIQIKPIFPSMPLNLKNMKLMQKQYLQNDIFKEFLVSTSKGIYTLKDCEKEQIGGSLLAVYTSIR